METSVFYFHFCPHYTNTSQFRLVQAVSSFGPTVADSLPGRGPIGGPGHGHGLQATIRPDGMTHTEVACPLTHGHGAVAVTPCPAQISEGPLPEGTPTTTATSPKVAVSRLRPTSLCRGP